MSKLTWLHLFLYLGWMLFAFNTLKEFELGYSIALIPTFAWVLVMSGRGWSIKKAFWHENM